MITWSGPVQVFGCLEPTDMRKSFNCLCGVVENQMKQEVDSGQLFLFFNKRRDRVKILQAVEDGMILFYKRLERGTFEIPREEVIKGTAANRTEGSSRCIVMKASVLSLILEGIDLGSVRHRKWWRTASAKLANQA